ncbi:MAG: hypothetical protein Q9188_006530 [Gyalolechia gomerana]
MPEDNLHLLALDGGGVRGLSSLIVLKQLMETVDPDSPPKPCDYFDMIGGTSTGGLIAIMLGRLKLSIDECIDAYLSLSDRVFQKKSHRVTIRGSIQGRFDSEELERAVKEVIAKQGLHQDALLKDVSDDACKVFVCATSKQTSEIVCLTSYKSPRPGSGLLNSVKIWEACRATSAASSFFDPIAIRPYEEEFVDGATGANNPVWKVWDQAQLIWGPEPLEGRVKRLVSIGTGIPSLKPFKDDVPRIGTTLLAIATETEQTAEDFRRDKMYLDNTSRYYRFNVAHGLEDIGLEESKKRKEIAAVTRRYVRLQEVFKQMQACANNIDIPNHTGPTTPSSCFRNKYFEVPRNPISVFTGREEVCEQLHAHCSPSGKTNIQRQQKRFVIHGLGGSGKTQVCLKFAEDHREEFWGIFWLDASSAESLERGYLRVAEVCGLEARVSVVQRWLSNISEPWALVLDNADDPRLDISRYFPVGNRGVVLITTRNPDCKLYSTVGSYELGGMATDEAVTLLLRTAGVDNISNRLIRDAAESVVHTLGYLALAITQAGAVIRQGYCKMEEYCALYSRRRKELLSQKAIQGGEDYRYTVYTTWVVSRQMIEEMSTEAGQDALALLRMFSFLHYEGISEEIFDWVWQHLYKDRQSDWMISHQLKMLVRQSDQEWDVYPLRVAISLLRSFSLISRDKNDLISVHPLVHSWTRDQMSVSDEDTVWTQTTATIALSIPWTFEIADYRFRRSMMPHIDACLGFRGDGVFSLQSVGGECQRMASNFALVYSEVGRRQEALQLRKRVVEL